MPAIRPSDALAMIAGAIHRLECAEDPTGTVGGWLEQALDELDSTPPEDPPAWTIEPLALFGTPVLAAIKNWPPGVPTDGKDFLNLAAALQLLDRWHRPLVPDADGRVFDYLEGHHDAEDMLEEYCRFGGDRSGIIIPARAWALHRDRPRSASFERWHGSLRTTKERPQPRPLLLARLMFHTIYLPNEIEAQDASIDGNLKSRRVKLRYVRPPMNSNSSPMTNLPIVAVAPMAETESDVRFILTGGAIRYAVTPIYPRNRIELVIEGAIHKNADVLFFPETSVAESDLEYLRSTILKSSRTYARQRGAPPALRYVFAGISGPPDISSQPAHRNFVVMLDSKGLEVMRQDKMFPWDMTAAQVDKFGLLKALNIAALPGGLLFEDIKPADQVDLADLWDFGRVLTLICADMNYNLPGDWFLDHCKLDWLHAPIMDQHIKDLIVSPKAVSASWIGLRAHRASYGGNERVVVTNSMALTCMLNLANKAKVERGEKVEGDVPIDPCGIALLVDASSEDPTYDLVMVPIHSSSPVIEIRRWGKGWGGFHP